MITIIRLEAEKVFVHTFNNYKIFDKIPSDRRESFVSKMSICKILMFSSESESKRSEV